VSVVGGTGRFHGAAGRSFAEVTGGALVLDASDNPVPAPVETDHRFRSKLTTDSGRI